MKPARSLFSAILLGCIAVFSVCVIGCASQRAVVEPPVEPPVGTASPSPVVDPAPSPPLGPPPGYVKPDNYWMREKFILTSEPEPPASATQKSSGKKGKKKTGKQVTE
jgi:hypothetical protein